MNSTRLKRTFDNQLAKEEDGKYKPRFSFKECKVFDYYSCPKSDAISICDKDKVIATILPAGVLPSVAKIANVSLTTTGYTIGWLDIMHSEGCFSDIKIALDNSNPEALKITCKGEEKKKGFEVQAESVLTYDNSLNSYVYEITIENILKKQQGYERLSKACGDWVMLNEYGDEGLTYCNVAPPGYPADYGPRKYFLFEDRAGGVTKVPWHTLLAPDKANIRPRKGGARLVICGDSERVTIIELMGQTATNSHIGLCNALYDVWLKWMPQPGRRRFVSKLKIYSCEKRVVDGFLKRARVAPLTDQELSMYAHPKYKGNHHPLSDFESGMDPRVVDFSAFWVPIGDMTKTEWRQDGGHSGKGALRTHSDTPAECLWGVWDSPVGQSTTVPAGKQAVVSVWIKTENLKGKGAYFKVWLSEKPQLQCLVWLYRLDKTAKVFESDKLNGTNDWTKVSMAVPSVLRQDTYFTVGLVHKGKGASYFDDVDYTLK